MMEKVKWYLMGKCLMLNCIVVRFRWRLRVPYSSRKNKKLKMTGWKTLDHIIFTLRVGTVQSFAPTAYGSGDDRMGESDEYIHEKKLRPPT